MSYSNVYYKKNKKRFKERARTYRRQSNGEYTKKLKRWRLSNPSKQMLIACRQRAKKQNVPFNLEETDIIIPQTCPVLGIPLVVGAGRFHNSSPSVDRLVPSKGYVTGNIIVVSFRANRIKHDATPEELKKVADFYNKGDNSASV